MPKKNKAFRSAPYICLECLSIIRSRYEGEFVTCSCGKCAVDQSELINRTLGYPKKVKDLEVVSTSDYYQEVVVRTLSGKECRLSFIGTEETVKEFCRKNYIHLTGRRPFSGHDLSAPTGPSESM